MEYEQIKKIIEDMSNSKLSSIDIEFPEGTKISMKKDINIQNIVVENKEHSKTEEIKANEGKAQESSKKFRDAYKYDVVKDYVEKLENTIDKQVRKESKNQNRDEEER